MDNLHENVERWLIQENYSFNEIKTNEDNFKIIIKMLMDLAITWKFLNQNNKSVY